MYHIIANQQRGKISAKDLEILNSWIESSDQNRKDYDEIVSLWKLSGNIEQVDADIDNEWQKFSKLKEENRDNFRKISLTATWKPFYKIAAVLIPVIILSVTAIFFYNLRDSQWISLVSGAEKKYLLLQDSTEVWLNQDTEIIYPKNLRKQRVVKVKGEAYFKVYKTGTKFKVDAGSSFVQVMGTKFNVDCRNDSITRVNVDEGRVLFYAKAEPRKQLSLVAGEKGILQKEILTRETESSLNTSAWTSNQLIFQNTPMNQVETDLEKYFSINIVLSDSLAGCRFSGEFKDPELTNILEVIALATGGSISQAGDRYFITGRSCD